MTFIIERRRPKLLEKKKGHFASLGFTNRLALYIMLFLAIGLAGGFYLALKSIAAGYTGALMCWTVVFTPIGTACSVVLSRIVDKSRAENTGGSGDGIKYAIAKAKNFQETTPSAPASDDGDSVNSPAI